MRINERPDPLRRRLFHAYKADRPPKTDSFIAATQDLRQILPAMGVAQAEGEEGEADDVLYTLAATWPGRVGVYAIDKDLLQVAALTDSTVIKPDLRQREKDDRG